MSYNVSGTDNGLLLIVLIVAFDDLSTEIIIHSLYLSLFQLTAEKEKRIKILNIF